MLVSLGSLVGKYSFRKARYCLMPASSFDCASDTALMILLATMPTDLSGPAGPRMALIDVLEVGTKYSRGRQPTSWARAMAWEANLPSAMLKNASAPDALSARICESTVGSVTS